MVPQPNYHHHHHHSTPPPPSNAIYHSTPKPIYHSSPKPRAPKGIPDHVKILNPEAPLYAPTTPKPASLYHHQQHHYSTTYSPYSAQVNLY